MPTSKNLVRWKTGFMGVLFEKWVISSLTKNYGFRLSSTPATGDKGIDFVGSMGKHIPVIGQSKHYCKSLPVRTLREFEGVLALDKTSGGALGIMASRTPLSAASMWHFHRSDFPMLAFVSHDSSGEGSTKAAEQDLSGLPLLSRLQRKYADEKPEIAAQQLLEHAQGIAQGDESSGDLTEVFGMFPAQWQITANYAAQNWLPESFAIALSRSADGRVYSKLQVLGNSSEAKAT